MNPSTIGKVFQPPDTTGASCLDSSCIPAIWHGRLGVMGSSQLLSSPTTLNAPPFCLHGRVDYCNTKPGLYSYSNSPTFPGRPLIPDPGCLPWPCHSSSKSETCSRQVESPLSYPKALPLPSPQENSTKFLFLSSQEAHPGQQAQS